MVTPPPLTTQNPYLRAESLSDLLSWWDVDFVRCAFVTVLGRQPDAEGEAYYTSLVRRGHSKTEILWRLRKSVEGKAHDPGIAGLDRLLKRAKRGRWPILGRWLSPAESNSIARRENRILLNEFASMRAQINQIGADIKVMQHTHANDGFRDPHYPSSSNVEGNSSIDRLADMPNRDPSAKFSSQESPVELSAAATAIFKAISS